jgi:hypothetical protein
MALADGQTEAKLAAACEAFVGTPRPVPIMEPTVDSISGFIAVVPAQPSPRLQQLAADATREFDSFRAPLTSKDRARRNPDKLTPRQCEYLDRWGYPCAMEEFRFHMTLTGRLDAAGARPSWRCCAIAFPHFALSDWRSIAWLCSVRTMPPPASASSGTGPCAMEAPEAWSMIGSD